MKGLRVTKIVNKIKYEGVWGELEAKKMFPEATIQTWFMSNSSFRVKS